MPTRRRSTGATALLAPSQDSVRTIQGLDDASIVKRAEFFLVGAGAGAMLLWGGLGFDRGEGDPRDVAIVLSGATILSVAHFIKAPKRLQFVPVGYDAEAWRRDATARRRVSLWVGSVAGVAGMLVLGAAFLTET